MHFFLVVLFTFDETKEATIIARLTKLLPCHALYFSCVPHFSTSQAYNSCSAETKAVRPAVLVFPHDRPPTVSGTRSTAHQISSMGPATFATDSLTFTSKLEQHTTSPKPPELCCSPLQAFFKRSMKSS